MRQHILWRSGRSSFNPFACDREIISRMKAPFRTVLFAAALLSAAPVISLQGRAQERESDTLTQGRQLERGGKLEGALALYQETLRSSPDSFPYNIAAGDVLDLLGRGEAARAHFERAIKSADTPDHKAMAERSVAMSYAFEGSCSKTVEYEQEVFDYFAAGKNFYQQGEVADEAARVCIDSGDLDAAEKWYRAGHEIGLKEPNVKPERVDLWNFRWEHAAARLAARRGNHASAEQHVAAAKAILDKGTIPQQAAFFPYLQGYVAFYGGDYQSALEQFRQANQDDPFIQCMIGQTYEKLGQQEKAVEFYRKAAAAISHNPPAAYAVPYARKRLAAFQ